MSVLIATGDLWNERDGSEIAPFGLERWDRFETWANVIPTRVDPSWSSLLLASSGGDGRTQ